MNSAARNAVVALLVICLTGCVDKKARTVPPAQAQAPAIDAGKAGALYPPPLTQAQVEPQPQTPEPEPAPKAAEPTPQPLPPPSNSGKTPSKHKPKPSPVKNSNPATSLPAAGAEATAATPPPASSASADPPAEVTAVGEPAAASPIGQLSTAGTSGQTQNQKQTADLITNTENSLNGIKRPLNTQEQETANQIKTFLAKAKQALSNQDPDGALTLATKAKVLLDELNKT